MKRLLTSPTFLVIVIFLTGWSLAFVYFAHWKKRPIIEQDVVGYYSYLPAMFIYQDPGMDVANGNPFFESRVWGVPGPRGGLIQKYTMGMAVMYSPFFFTAHLLAGAWDYPSDGYSDPYRILLLFSGVVYGVLGLMMLRKLLLRWFSERVSALVMVGVAAGTNLNFYVINDAAMPHAALFFLVTLFAWLCLRFFDAPSFRRSLALGLCGGLIVLIRPNHLVLWLLPVCIGLAMEGGWKAKGEFIKSHGPKIMIWPLCVFLVFLPQMLYWHHLSGQWFYYSYGKEGFFWTHPQLVETLIGYRKGWLLYTPLMILAIAGMFVLKRYAKELRLALPVLLLVTAYILSSWWCWWYGGSFGSRAFIDLYGLLAVGIAAAFTFIIQKVRFGKFILIPLVAFFILLNNFQSLQYSWGSLHHDAMTREAYWAIFLNPNPVPGYEQLLDHPDYQKALEGIY